MFKKPFVIALVALACSTAFSAPGVHTTDFITNANRTSLVDFETLGAANNLGGSFTQSGVNVNQVNGSANGIWTSCAGACWYANTSLTWYPNGGDFGWTEITRANGSDFMDLGMDIGSIIFGYATVQYELLNDGVSVMLGSFTFAGGTDGYLGFSGGSFDQVRLRALETGAGGTFGDGRLQALAIDNLELSGSNAVPEPATLALLGLGLLGAAVNQRRRPT